MASGSAFSWVEEFIRTLGPRWMPSGANPTKVKETWPGWLAVQDRWLRWIKTRGPVVSSCLEPASTVTGTAVPTNEQEAHAFIEQVISARPFDVLVDEWPELKKVQKSSKDGQDNNRWLSQVILLQLAQIDEFALLRGPLQTHLSSGLIPLIPDVETKGKAQYIHRVFTVVHPIALEYSKTAPSLFRTTGSGAKHARTALDRLLSSGVVLTLFIFYGFSED